MQTVRFGDTKIGRHRLPGPHQIFTVHVPSRRLPSRLFQLVEGRQICRQGNQEKKLLRTTHIDRQTHILPYKERCTNIGDWMSCEKIGKKIFDQKYSIKKIEKILKKFQNFFLKVNRPISLIQFFGIFPRIFPNFFHLRISLHPSLHWILITQSIANAHIHEYG